MSDKTILGVIAVFVLAFACGIVYLFVVAEREHPAPARPPEVQAGAGGGQGPGPMTEITGPGRSAP